MTVQSWMLRSWPIVEWKPGTSGAPFPDFFHVNTRTREGHGDLVLSYGDTVWLGEIDGRSVGVSFEWIEIRPGVIILSDPNSIHTNIALATEEAELADDLQTITFMNSLVHQLPWQGAVHAVLAANSQRHEMTLSRRHATSTRRNNHNTPLPMLGHGLVAAEVEPAIES